MTFNFSHYIKTIYGSSCPRIRAIFFIFLSLFIVTFQIYLTVWGQIFDAHEVFYKNGSVNQLYRATISPKPIEKPVILAWTWFVTHPMMEMFLGIGTHYTNKVAISPFREQDCPFKCIYTDNKSEENIKKAAMMVFHIWNNESDFNANDLPPPNPERLNVFFQTESAANSGREFNVSKVQNMFNLTMTYSAKSDIFLPYDKFERIEFHNLKPEEVWSEEEVEKKVAGKTQLVLQFVSNCETKSGREKYVAKLAEHINVTQYGDCSGKKCPTEDDKNHYDGSKNDDCFDQEIDKHMFYLALENSVCNHYMTEKFWHIKQLIVPIVLSRRVFKGLDIPHDSYISADDFASVKDLTTYLLKLEQDKSQYKKYFGWTKVYKKSRSSQNPLCKLCKLAIERKPRQKRNIADWWQNNGDCEYGETVDKLLNGTLEDSIEILLQ